MSEQTTHEMRERPGQAARPLPELADDTAALASALTSAGGSTGEPTDAPRSLCRADAGSRTRTLQRMQAQQGNAYVQRVVGSLRTRQSLQRQPTPSTSTGVTPGLDASMFQVSMTEKPAPSGTVTTKVEGSGENALVKATAPEIHFKATITLAPTVNLGGTESIKVGPVQTMTGTERVGVYKKDGKVVAELSQSHGMVRDARPLKYAEDKDKKEVFAAEPPFYDRPRDISDTLPSASVEFIDRPAMGLPLEFGGGKLSAIRGADKFNTSIGAKRGGQILTMNPFGWQVDWTTELKEDFSVATDEKGNPLAKGITTWAEEKGIALNTEEWAKLALQDQPWVMKFTTVEAAMTQSALSLLLALDAARQADPASAALIEDALKKKNPSFAVTVTLNRSVKRSWTDAWSVDEVLVFAHLTRQAATQGPVNIANTQSHTWNFSFNDLSEPSAVTPQAVLGVWAGGGTAKAPILGDTAEFPFPFTGAKTIQPSGANKFHTAGEYLIRVALNG